MLPALVIQVGRVHRPARQLQDAAGRHKHALDGDFREVVVHHHWFLVFTNDDASVGGRLVGIKNLAYLNAAYTTIP